MASPVQAKAVVLYAKIGSVYYPVACAKDVSITTTADLLELASRSSSVWREYEYSRLTGEITGSGITKITADPDSEYTIFDVIGQQFSLLKFMVKYSAYDPSGNYKVFECNVLVKEVNIAGSASALSNYTYNFQITGPVTLTSTPVENTNPQILIYEYDATGAVSSLTLDTFGDNAEIIVVYIDRDGAGGESHRVVLHPDGYTSNEVQYNASTKVLTFGTALANGDYVKIVYVDTDVILSAFALEDGSGNVIEDGSGNEIITE